MVAVCFISRISSFCSGSIGYGSQSFHESWQTRMTAPRSLLQVHRLSRASVLPLAHYRESSMQYRISLSVEMHSPRAQRKDGDRTWSPDACSSGCITRPGLGASSLARSIPSFNEPQQSDGWDACSSVMFTVLLCICLSLNRIGTEG